MANVDIFGVSQDRYKQAAQSFIEKMKVIQKKDKALAERAEGAENIAEAWLDPGKKFIALAPNGQVVGLMILENKQDHLKMHDICTDPTTKGVGFELMKRAVNESQKHGHAGKIKLSDMSGSNFYRRLGFTQDEGEKLAMTLVPDETNGLWVRVKETGMRQWTVQ